MTEIDIARHAVTEARVWGWEIPTYLFLGGMAAGILILVSLLPRERSRAARWLAFAPAVLVSLGMGALFLDLAHKTHVLRFYAAFRWTSPMSWGAWILVLVYPVSLLVALAGLTDAQTPRGLLRLRSFAQRHAGTLRRANLVAGVALGVYTGILLSTLGARALWNSALLGPLFLASGLSSGAAFLLLFKLSHEERRYTARADRIALGLEALLLALFLIGLSTSSAAGRDAAASLLGGPFTAPFWTLVVLAGLAIPWSLEFLESRLHFRATLAAPALVLLGGLSLRWILVAAGQG